MRSPVQSWVPLQTIMADPKVPKGPRRGREIPLIGVADVSLRGLGNPKKGEQKTFGLPSFSIRVAEIRPTAPSFPHPRSIH